MIELLRTAEMADADRLTIAGGTPGIALMEEAGDAVAVRAAMMARAGSRIAVVAGPGNNGGDGYVAARQLAERGFAVRVLRVGDRPGTGDAAEAARRWSGEVMPAAPDALDGCGLVIDALFGAGLARPVESLAAALVAAVNAAGVPVLAVDLPSGINGDTGAVQGCAVRATETVTFFRRKPGHLLYPGRAHCGRTHVVDIGIPDAVLARIAPRIAVNAPALWRTAFPVLRPDGHKYDRGHALVVSGGLSSTGAARLAARGALRAGAGLVTLASPREALAVNAATNLAVMVRPAGGAGEIAALLEDRRFNAVVVGPGGGVGAGMRETVETVLGSGAAAVLDADAITSFAGEPEALAAAISARTAPVVMTPHEGEFSRFFKKIESISKLHSKLEKTLAASSYTGAIVLLKGADTVVAAPDGRAAIAENAPPWLATAGSGDVLAGLIAGLMAQRMPAFEAAAAAVWLHGEAANKVGPGLISEDLPEALPAVLRRLAARHH